MFFKFLRFAPILAGMAMMWLSFAAGQAKAQPVEWRGYFDLYDFSEACEQHGWRGVANGVARFRPSNMGSNGPDTRLSVFMREYSINIVREGARFDNRWRAVLYHGLGTGLDTSRNVQRRVTTQTPGNGALTSATPQVRLVGTLRNFSGLQNCTASIEATMLRAR